MTINEHLDRSIATFQSVRDYARMMGNEGAFDYALESLTAIRAACQNYQTTLDAHGELCLSQAKRIAALTVELDAAIRDAQFTELAAKGAADQSRERVNALEEALRESRRELVLLHMKMANTQYISAFDNIMLLYATIDTALSTVAPKPQEPAPVIPEFLRDMSTEQRKLFVERFNNASKEEIAQIMEKLPTDALEWAVKFEAMGSPATPERSEGENANQESTS